MLVRTAVSSARRASRLARCFSSEAFGGRAPADATPDTSFGTLCIHGGQQPDPITGSRVPAIHQNTGFVFRDSDDAAAKFNLAAFGPIYTRIGNPTCDALEAKLCALEGGMAALTCASGHAAQLLAFTNLLNPGDNFVTTNKLYGGTATQFSRQFKQFGWEARFADADDMSAIEDEIDENTKAVFCEVIANPGGVIVDLEALVEVAHRHGLPVIVDNTSATPYLIRPFDWGADIVLHSATKFLCGHGNAVAGAIVEKGDFDWGSGKFPILSEPCDSYHGMSFYEVFGKDGPVAEMFGTEGETGMAFAIAARALGLRDCGPCLSPHNAFLVNMGIETLPLRVQRQCDNALAVAEFLESHPKVEEVSYCGLPSNKYYDLAKKYTGDKGPGALFSFSVKGGYEAAQKLVDTVEMISLVANLGDIRTLVAHPASMMHRQLTEDQQRAAGAGPEVIRLSIGIEDAHDIIADLDQALQ